MEMSYSLYAAFSAALVGVKSSTSALFSCRPSYGRMRMDKGGDEGEEGEGDVLGRETVECEDRETEERVGWKGEDTHDTAEANGLSTTADDMNEWGDMGILPSGEERLDDEARNVVGEAREVGEEGDACTWEVLGSGMFCRREADSEENCGVNS